MKIERGLGKKTFHTSLTFEVFLKRPNSNKSIFFKQNFSTLTHNICADYVTLWFNWIQFELYSVVELFILIKHEHNSSDFSHNLSTLNIELFFMKHLRLTHKIQNFWLREGRFWNIKIPPLCLWSIFNLIWFNIQKFHLV